MRRVSSRQRLVSWDAFDATANYSDESDSEYSAVDNIYPETSEIVPMTTKLHITGDTVGSCDDLVEVGRLHAKLNPAGLGQNSRRKRSRRKYSGPTIVPSFSWELSQSPQTHFQDMVEDVQLHVFSFLDKEGLRTVMSLNHKIRDLISSKEAQHSVWKQHFDKAWPMMKFESMSLVDSCHLPVATRASRATSHAHQVNVPLLLSMTPDALPSCVDESLLERATPRGTRRLPSRHRSEARTTSSNLEVLRRTNEDGTPIESVRYTGPIGAGDRCIRANNPLPRPVRKNPSKSQKSTYNFYKGKSTTLQPTLFDLLCRGSRAVTRTLMHDWRPFVSPFVQEDGSLDVTPRMMSYFEVEISDGYDDASDSDEDTPNPLRRGRNECVAVGVATDKFHVHSRMPGWDSMSFGYHGDDGGIFHSSGGMIDEFGPKYGAGDTVGCGIDYINQGIFFTLNGKFLGYGWKHVDPDFLSQDLFPVVGIDTNVPVAFNFGNTKPFKFDFGEFHKKQGGMIEPQYRFSSNTLRSKSHYKLHRESILLPEYQV